MIEDCSWVSGKRDCWLQPRWKADETEDCSPGGRKRGWGIAARAGASYFSSTSVQWEIHIMNGTFNWRFKRSDIQKVFSLPSNPFRQQMSAEQLPYTSKQQERRFTVISYQMRKIPICLVLKTEHSILSTRLHMPFLCVPYRPGWVSL